MVILSLGVKGQAYLDTIFWVKVVSPNIYATQGFPLSNNSILNSLFETYQVRYFNEALPFAKNPELRKIHEIHLIGNIDSLISKMQTYLPDDFTSYSKFEISDSTKFVYDPVDYMWQLTLQDPDNWLWHLKKTDCDKAWDITLGSSNLKIAVIDIGLDITHPDLATKIFPPYDPYDQYVYGCLYSTQLGHGTAVASFAGAETTEQGDTANGQLASAGFKVMMIFYRSPWDRKPFLQKALHASNVMGAKIIVSCANGSLHCEPDLSSGEDLITKEILDNGTAIIMPAGNGYGGTHCQYDYPPYEQHAFYPFNPEYDSRIIIVTGTDKEDYHQHYNNGVEVTQSHFPAVDICAPGFDLMGADVTDCGANHWPYYGFSSGTSFAAPIVASIASLIYSVDPCLEPGDLEYILKSTTDPVNDAGNYPGLIGTGRINAYHAVEAAQTYGNTSDITSNTLWDTERYVRNTVTIHAGHTLTVTAKIRLNPNAKLIVEQGAGLIIDGGTLTNSNGCHNSWPGIEVWGNSTLSQNPANQGIIHILNGGTIENAKIGILVSKRECFDCEEQENGFGGGMVHCDSGYLINNKIAVEFAPYSFTNNSYFKRTNFITSAELPDNELPDYFVKMLEVHGVTFRGCSFVNTRTEEEAPYDQRGTGIFAENSGVRVWEACLNQSDPCDHIRQSVFEHLTRGIYDLNSGSSYNPIITNTFFLNNLKGLYLSGFSGVSNACVTFNKFQINMGPASCYSNDCVYGMYLDQCSGYTVEENEFYCDYTSQKGVGLVVNNSGGYESNRIYRNTFSNFEIGAVGQNKNRSVAGIGLCFKCNTFSSNIIDIAVTKDPELPSSYEFGIAVNQGSPTPDPGQPLTTAPAGNVFSAIGGSHNWDINNQLNHFNYYFHSDGGGYKVFPFPTNGPITKHMVFATYFPPISCPSSSGSGGDSGEDYMKMMEASEQTDSLIGVLIALTDGGSTPELNAEVEESTPSEAMAMYDELLVKSPYLSDSVMITAVEKEEVLDNAMIRDVLVSNTHSAKSDTIIEKLENRQVPMPEYMMAEILAGEDSISPKEILEAKKAYWDGERSRYYHDLIRYFNVDSINQVLEDSLVNLLVLRNTPEAYYDLTAFYATKGDTMLADYTLNSISTLFSLTQVQQQVQQDYQTFYDLSKEINLDTSGTFVITDERKSLLENFLNEDPELPNVFARNILIASDNLVYSEPIFLPESGYKSSTRDKYNSAKPSVDSPILKVYPNPTHDYFIAEYNVNDGNGFLELAICDISGKKIQSIQLRNKIDALVIHTDKLPSGIYLISVISQGKSIGTEKLTLCR